jgi:hypothetical protein
VPRCSHSFVLLPLQHGGKHLRYPEFIRLCLGIQVLSCFSAVLELKIDYRDGLVEFVYDPERSHAQNWRTK